MEKHTIKDVPVEKEKVSEGSTVRVDKENVSEGSIVLVGKGKVSEGSTVRVEKEKVSEGSTDSWFSGLVRLTEDNARYIDIERSFITNLATLGMVTHIHAIHHNTLSTVTGKAKLEAFENFLRTTAEKNNGDGNVKYAWYCGSKQDISTVLSHGFGHTVKSGIYGRGIYLSPLANPLPSLHLSTSDEKGLRHLLLCRVILGRMELVGPGSDQSHPGSEDLGSGVDDLSNPMEYIIWTTRMNTHILPEFVVSIGLPSTKEISI